MTSVEVKWIDDHGGEWRIICTVAPIREAQLSGPPEWCREAEGGEVTYLRVSSADRQELRGVDIFNWIEAKAEERRAFEGFSEEQLSNLLDDVYGEIDDLAREQARLLEQEEAF